MMNNAKFEYHKLSMLSLEGYIVFVKGECGRVLYPFIRWDTRNNKLHEI